MGPPITVQRPRHMGVSLSSELEIQMSILGKKNGITAPIVPSKQGLAAAIAGSSCIRSPARTRSRALARRPRSWMIVNIRYAQGATAGQGPFSVCPPNVGKIKGARSTAKPERQVSVWNCHSTNRHERQVMAANRPSSRGDDRLFRPGNPQSRARGPSTPRRAAGISP